jgi:hypothetical protein
VYWRYKIRARKYFADILLISSQINLNSSRRLAPLYELHIFVQLRSLNARVRQLVFTKFYLLKFWHAAYKTHSLLVWYILKVERFINNNNNNNSCWALYTCTCFRFSKFVFHVFVYSFIDLNKNKFFRLNSGQCIYRDYGSHLSSPSGNYLYAEYWKNKWKYEEKNLHSRL